MITKGSGGSHYLLMTGPCTKAFQEQQKNNRRTKGESRIVQAIDTNNDIRF